MSTDLALSAPDPVRPGLGSVLERVRHVAAQPAVAKSLPMIGLVALLGLAAIVWMTMSQPPQRDLFRGLADGDKAAVADALKASNIAYRIDRDTGALTVSEGDFYQAKMLLAQQGLPKSAPDGDAMITSLPLGASRAVEGERLRGARELDLARTIEAIDAVESAKVHLAVEQPSVFLRDRAEPAASVMLRLHAGRTLGDSQVQAIVHLVASSVPGLAPDGVSVVDQSGRLLSRVGGQADGGASDRQVEIQARIEARYQEALAKLLTPLVGADNFAAEVHADLDFAEVQATRESYPKDLSGLREEQGTVTSGNGPDETGGIPGALSNQPPPTAQPSATPPTPPATAAATATPAPAGPKTENYNRTFELGREVSVTKQPVGQVKRLTIAVALKQGGTRRTAKELAEIEQLVRNAVGFDPARGDTIALSARTFVDPANAGANGPKWWEASWVSLLARNLSALLIAALVVFGVAKPLLKRRAAATADLPAPVRAARKAEIGTEIAAAIAHEARHDPSRPVTLDMIEAAPGYANRAALIRNFVRQDPARAALVVRDLIRSDMPGGEERDG